MFKKILAAAAATLALAACGGSDEPTADAAPTTEAEFYDVDGFDVTTTEAPAVDLSEYGTDLIALYRDLPDYRCEPLSVGRDISNAIYVDDEDCPMWIEGRPNPRGTYSVRIYQDADAATEALAYHVENGTLDRPAYRTDNYVVRAETRDDLDTFIETFGGSK